MPSIAVSKTKLAQLIGQDIPTEQLQNSLFDFGVELDGTYEENGQLMYKLDIAANRYDLLCVEGLARAMRSYLFGVVYCDIKNITNTLSKITVKKYKTDERHYLACGIICDIDMNDELYDSFITYQDKLHTSIGRNRSIVAIGTHDLDQLTNLSYEIEYKSTNLSDINFIPLNGNKLVNGLDLQSYLMTDKKLVKYFSLLNDQSRSVVFTANGAVISLPPIINSESTKITKNTKNIFIEVTGTDFKKVNTALKMLLYNFRGKSVEQVMIKDMETSTKIITPVFDNLAFKLRIDEILNKLKVKIEKNEMIRLLERMEYKVREDEYNPNCIIVEILDIRSDIMHECDILEDIAISYGFNNLKSEEPEILSIGKEDRLNRFVDKLRLECALCGFNEVLTLSLLSKDENIIDGNRAVIVANPQSKECEVVRTSLLPGLIKTVAANQHVKLPIRIFEAADIVILNENTCEGAENKRKICGLIAGNTSMLEEVHGPLTVLFQKCGITKFKYISEKEKNYLENQTAGVYVGEERIGTMGVVHPDVCKLFKVPYAMSAFEIDVELLYEKYNKNQ